VETSFAKHIKGPVFEAVAKAGKELGLPVYLVGGYVRDLLLERGSKDIDFLVVGGGIDLAQIVARQLPGKQHVSVFKNFGTAMIRWRDMELEFVGARKESYSTDSRKPVIEEGTLKDDLHRRDFTINALAISLNEEDFGTLLDPFSGLDDLRSRTIRTPLDPDITFSDDPLRMLRAIRFACQLGFSIHKDTFHAIQQQAERLQIISMERVRDEVNKILETPKPSIGFNLLMESGLLRSSSLKW